MFVPAEALEALRDAHAHPYGEPALGIYLLA